MQNRIINFCVNIDNKKVFFIIMSSWLEVGTRNIWYWMVNFVFYLLHLAKLLLK
jgi:hypothetical protein